MAVDYNGRCINKLSRIFFLFFFLVSSTSLAFGGYKSCGTNCYLADTPSSADVQAAIDAAEAARGGTVNIPAGTVTYTTRVGDLFTAIKHDLKIVGAGNGMSGTVITDRTSGEQVFAFRIDGSTKFEISNMRLISKTGANTDGTLSIRGTSISQIVHDITFDMTGINGGRMVTWGNPNDANQGGGVFYYCTWNNPTNTGQGISLFGKTSPDWVGNPSWGSASNKYIEDCTFNFTGGQGDGAFDAYSGAKAVFRYNTLVGTSVGWHGNDSSTSAHSFEIYNNTFTATSSQSFAINIRGGTALIYNNTFDSHYPTTITLSHYRSCQALGIDGQLCDNTGGGGAAHDGNSDVTGYMCYQQPGATGSNGITSSPLYQWNNTSGSSAMTFGYNGNFVNPRCGHTYDMRDHVKVNRDYFNSSYSYKALVHPHPLVATSTLIKK